MEGAELYREHFDRIEASIRMNLARHGIYGADAEDFRQEIHLYLIEDDYSRLSAYRGESSFGAFIDQVVRSRVRDLIRRRNGRLDRPSASANHAGLSAVELENLRNQGFSCDEAVEMLLRNGNRLGREQLEELWPHTRDRSRRYEVPADELERRPADEPPPDAPSEDELSRRLARFLAVIQTLLAGLDDEERWFAQQVLAGMRVTDIATALGVDRARLYPKRRRLLDRIRQACEAAGLTWPEVEDLADWPGFYFDFPKDGDSDEESVPDDGEPESGEPEPGEPGPEGDEGTGQGPRGSDR